MQSIEVIEVRLWGQRVGALSALKSKPGIYEFQYSPQFVDAGLSLSPLMMPLDKNRRYYFPHLRRETYAGLPGLLADALPDHFGNALIDEYLSRHGVSQDQITTLHKLLYIGNRAMGALEFEPAVNHPLHQEQTNPLEMSHLVEGARKALRGKFDSVTQDMIDVGSSAGGARAKAVVGWNETTQELLSGQFDLPKGFEHWLLKFDGVGDNKRLGSTHGFGRIEYAHYLMASDAGIQMSPCRLLEENGRAHFMTKRFDREGNEKLHIHSLCGIQHLDFNLPYMHSYEQYLRTVLQLKLGAKAIEQAWLRCVFNVMIKNCDDHTKNLSFLMRKTGTWELAPAYDLCFAHNPNPERWTHQHQMLVNGKASGIQVDDLLILAKEFGIHEPRIKIQKLNDALQQWPEFAKQADVLPKDIRRIQAYHRFD